MSKRIFTTAEIEELSKNKNVSKCSDKSITYNKHFKVLAVKKYYEEGYSPTMIFKEAGFDMNIIGIEVPNACLHRWKKIYNNKGENALNSESRGLSGRPRKSWSSDAEKIKYLEIKIAYLKAENDFLVKLRAAKKRQN